MDDTKRMLTAMVLCMAIMLGWFYMTGKHKKRPPELPATLTPVQNPEQPSAAPPPTAAETSLLGAAPSLSAGSWHVKEVGIGQQDIILGETQVQPTGYKAQITIDSASASIGRVLLSEYKLKVTDDHTGYPVLATAHDQNNRQISSLMLGELKIDGRPEAFDLAGACWKEANASADAAGSSVSYVATIVNDKGKPVLEVVKTFAYAPDDYQLVFDLKLINRSPAPLKVTSLEMFGPVGPSREDPRSDRRNAAAANRTVDGQIKIAQKPLPTIRSEPAEGLLDKPDTASLQWFSVANKFFAGILRPLPGEGATKPDYISQGRVEALALETGDGAWTLGARATIATPLPLAAGGQLTYNFLMYVGPIDQDIFAQEAYAQLGYEKLLGGRSCFCAFDFLTHALLKVMKGIHQVTGNYGIAIILLVLVVRLLLHPIMKKSQANMMKMQKMQPRMEEIKKKYANNKEEMQRQMQGMYKEQGPAMILGCLPMFLQMPIWIALYMAADANVALRHQGLLPASWHWLNDLSAPDRLIPFSWLGIEPVNLPIIGNLVGTIDAINLLPMLLCVAMYLQQKLSPQSAMAASNPQAAQQQKMMLIMMPVMMLLFLYSAPSGVNLYIMSSTFAGIIEQKRIRKHLAEQQAQQDAVTVAATSKVTGKFGPKKPKPKPPVRFN